MNRRDLKGLHRSGAGHEMLISASISATEGFTLQTREVTRRPYSNKEQRSRIRLFFKWMEDNRCCYKDCGLLKYLAQAAQYGGILAKVVD